MFRMGKSIKTEVNSCWGLGNRGNPERGATGNRHGIFRGVLKKF